MTNVNSYLHLSCLLLVSVNERHFSSKVHFATVHDRNGKEVDFLVTKDGKSWFLVEAKLADDRVSKNLEYFSNRLGVPGIQVINKDNIYKKTGNTLIISANRWLGLLT